MGSPSSLLRAIELAGAGRFREARAQVAEARRSGADSAIVHIVSGMVLYVCRNHQASLRAFDEAVATDPRSLRMAYAELIARAARLEWSHEIRDCVARAVEHDPNELRWRLESLRVYTNARDWARALQTADAALELSPAAAAVHMQRAAILSSLGRGVEALESAERAVHLAPQHAYRMEGARVALDVGDYGLAEKLYREAEEANRGDGSIPAAQAGLALMWGRLSEAEERAEAAHSRSPELPAALRIRGAVAVLRGDYVRAVSQLDAAIALAPEDYEARVWRAEAYTRTRRIDEAFDDLHEATMLSDGYLLPGLMIKSLTNFVRGDRYEAARVEEIADGVVELVPEGESDFLSGDHLRVWPVLEKAIVRLAGNRTTMPSRLMDGELTRLRTRTAPRYGSRWALELVRTASPETAMRELDGMVDRYPASSLPICHRGELKLWLGDLVGARADLEGAIAIKAETRWAWIGLTGVDTLEGNPERALATSAEGVRTMANTTGYSVYAYRADALRRLGRLEEALSDLHSSLGQNNAQRLGAWVLLALVHIARDDEDAFAATWRHLEDHAIGLLSDAAAESDIELWPTRDAVPEPAVAHEVLTHALHMMRGNRSSTCATYLTRDGHVRFVPRYPHHGHTPHVTDADDLRRAEHMLRTAGGQRGAR